jgi:hypothetical protein
MFRVLFESHFLFTTYPIKRESQSVTLGIAHPTEDLRHLPKT